MTRQGQEVKTEPRGENISVLKAATDDPKHPGWSARTPGGVGGQFRPRDGDGGSGTSGSADFPEGTPRPEHVALETATQTDASRGPAGVQYASATPPDISSVLTGNSRIDEVTKQLAQIYADTVETLERLPGKP